MYTYMRMASRLLLISTVPLIQCLLTYVSQDSRDVTATIPEHFIFPQF